MPSAMRWLKPALVLYMHASMRPELRALARRPTRVRDDAAVTLARALSDTFAGIAPGGVLAFIGAQLMGMAAAVVVGRWLWPHPGPVRA